MASQRKVKRVKGTEQDVSSPNMGKLWVGEEAARQAFKLLKIAEEIIELRKSLLHAQASIREAKIQQKAELTALREKEVIDVDVKSQLKQICSKLEISNPKYSVACGFTDAAAGDGCSKKPMCFRATELERTRFWNCYFALEKSNIAQLQTLDAYLTEKACDLELLLKEQRNELCKQLKGAKQKRPRPN